MSSNNAIVRPFCIKYNAASHYLHFQVAIEGTVGNNVSGDLAIDDIIITQGTCLSDKRKWSSYITKAEKHAFISTIKPLVLCTINGEVLEINMSAR